MRSLFKPATVVMSRLKYPQKFMLVGLLLLIPLIVVMTQYLSKVNEDIDFGSKEQLGLQYNDPVVTFLQHVQEHAALDNAVLRGENSLKDDLTAKREEVEAAIANGKAKAEKVAAAMGVKLLGVYEFMENTFDEERPPMPYQAMEMSMKSRTAMADQPSLDMEVQHSKTIHVNVEIWYRVSSF